MGYANVFKHVTLPTLEQLESETLSFKLSEECLVPKSEPILEKQKETVSIPVDSKPEEKKTATPDSKPEGEKKSTGLPSSLGLLDSFSDSEDSPD